MLYVYYFRFQFDLTLKASVYYWLITTLYILVLTLNIRQFHKHIWTCFGFSNYLIAFTGSKVESILENVYLAKTKGMSDLIEVLEMRILPSILKVH